MFTNKLKLSISSILFATIIAVLLLSVPQSASAQGTAGPQTYLIPSTYAAQLNRTYRCYTDYYVNQYGYPRGPGGYIYYIKIYPFGEPNNPVVYKTWDPTGTHQYDYTLDDQDGTFCYELVTFEELLLTAKSKLTPGVKYTAEVEGTYMQYDYDGSNRYCEDYYYYGTGTGMRIFADWNMDADFEDYVSPFYYTDPNKVEHINNYNYRYSYSDGRRIEDRWYHYGGYYTYDDACRPHIFYNDFTVPEDIETGYFRMRFISPYGYAYYYGSGGIYTITTYSQYYSNPNISYYYNTTYFYDYGSTVDLILGVSVGISDMYPSDEDGSNQLFVDELYDGTNRRLASDNLGTGPFYDFPNPSFEIEEPMPDGTKVTYAIYGPYPNPQLVYTALDPTDGTANVEIGTSTFPGAVYPYNYIISSASGEYAANGGNGNLLCDEGGEYEVRLTITPPGKKSRELRKRFSMSLANDLSVEDITSPLRNEAPFFTQYPLGHPVDIIVQYKNIGLNPINKFETTVTIEGPDGTEVFNKTITYDSNDPESAPLEINDAVPLNFGKFISAQGIGDYKFNVVSTLLSSNDMSTYNNDFPRVDGEDFIVTVTSEYEAEPLYSITPIAGSNDIVVNRPFRPKAQFRNNGLSDIGLAPAKMVFTLREDNSYSKESYMIIDDLPTDVIGGRTSTFPFVTLERAGLYDCMVIISVPDDSDRENDTIRFVFTVDETIHEGTYTIGNSVAGTDYATIEDAMNDLYGRGIDGPVVFELADPAYTLGAIDDYFPAWDFSTKIIGVNEDNTVTIRPSAEMSLIPRGVQITLQSAIGEGVRFGQNATNRYLESAYINTPSITDDQRLEYANSAGYIIFDGGENKSFVFTMFSDSKKSAAFALYQGSHDITIKNCIIENGQGSITSEFVPGTFFSALDGNVFESNFDAENNSASYTAGIVSRALIYNEAMDSNSGEGQQADDNESSADYDLIPNNNNVYADNEIVGFGYGVMSIGLGPILVADVNDNQYFENYYSQNTEITGNTIVDCGRSGVFLGFEQHATVANNIITGTGGTLVSAGIEIGGRAHEQYLGYNNMDVTVLNNRIAAVVGDGETHGILVEQAHNGYPDPSYGIVTFPDADDNIVIEGNAFWNITGGAPETSMYGITVMAERNEDYEYGTMKNTSADIKGIEITNNTVDINYDTDGITAGINILNINDATVINNAVAVSNTTSSSDINACMFFQSKLPENGGIESNYNVLYSSENVDAVRFTQAKQMMNDDDEIYVALLNNGYKGEFSTLRNWLAWTGSDINSTDANMNFMNDFVLSEQDIAIKPEVEFNALSNRGLNLDGKRTDCYGVTRGQSDEYFDAGALEFNISPLSVDFEAISVTSPLAYKEANGAYSDAEYLMVVDEGITMSALIRNNGSNFQEDIPVTFYAYRFNYDLIDWELVVENTVYVTAGKDEFVTATADEQLIPKTFAEEKWDAYIPNNNWYGMEENVTPLYKIVVRAGYDLNDDNNEIENVYRFYMRRAFEYKIMQSNESNLADLETVTGDNYAAAANAHAVTAALNDISIYNVSREEAAANFELNLDKDIEYRQDVDFLNRNGWPARSISYDGYKTVFYVDGNNSKFSRLDKIQLIDFINSGTNEKKHNFILASEELVRNQLLVDWDNGIDPDLDINGELRIEPRFPYSPLGLEDNFVDYNDFVDYSGNTVTGVNVGGLATFLIESTPQDIVDGMYPKPGLFNLVTDDYGFVKIGMVYDEIENPNFPEGGRIMSNTFNYQNRNATVMGVDWRHFEDVNNVMRAAIDVMNRNGGMVNPVELFTFDGKQVGDRVELNWSTASENGASHFEVERSNGDNFNKVAEVQAKGNSNLIEYYNATDNDVTIGETYTYRLKMVDEDGSYNYSNEITIEIDGTSLFEVSSVNPNPVTNTSKFNVTTTDASNVVIDLYNVSGTLVGNIFNGSINGVRSFEINAGDYPSGSYHVVIRSGEKATTLPVNIVR